jgi:primosomal protein N' (replication factor Y)
VSVARVIVDIPSRQVSGLFDYEIPAELADEVAVGCAVLVDFGNRPAVGWVAELAEHVERTELKPVRQVLAPSSFDEIGAQTAIWMAAEYCATAADCVRLFLPPGATPTAERTVSTGPDGREQITWALKGPRVTPVDERWIERVASSVYAPSARATAQRALLDALAEGPASASELTAELGTINSALGRLVEAGAVRVVARRRYRRPGGKTAGALRPAALSPGQDEALKAINAALDDGTGTILLDGITGSGKTEVYLQAIERVLATGSSAIVLVPEISLTPQTVGRFRSRFGDQVAVLHSRLSTGERLDEWTRLRDGDARVAVGARSAIFAPLPDVGLIVIDEEHDSSYKQGSAPRYHAIPVAERLARARGAVLVLGSATPAIESHAAADAGRWQRIELPERVAGGSIPGVTVVDMATEFAEGHRSMFSRPLLAELARVADSGTKAVLLLNRRGFASFLLCRECGFVPECDSCSTSMTYHETGPVLVCHHCNARRAVPPACPRCRSPYLRLFGAGTQRVEAELAGATPGLPVVRMDADTTTGKGGHERRLAEFEAMPRGILLGTQMVAKGLDYPEVTLVGVLNADTTLHLPDFRAGERTYQLLAQVAGRAGRGPLGGSVIVQTYWPDHPAIRAAATHDRAAFVAEELRVRRELSYPPFGRLANIVVSSAEQTAARSHAEQLAAALREEEIPGVNVLGPSPSPLARIKRAYRWHVTVKTPVGFDLGAFVCGALASLPRRRDVTVAPDIDAFDVL